MNIIIDTNIIRRDLKFKNRNYELMHDYLSKTNSRFVMPKIVLEEIAGVYKRFLIERRNDLEKSSQRLNSVLIKNHVDINMNIIIDEEVKEYIEYLKSNLKIKDDEIIKYKPEYLNYVVKRSIDRIKPFCKNGQEFRDAILWLSILDYVKLTEEKAIVFISDNPKDFSASGKNELHPELFKEAESSDVKIYYFKTLDDFIKEHAIKIDFINNEWLDKNIKIKTLENLFDKVIESDNPMMLDIISDSLESNKEVTNYIASTGYINFSLEDFYVYEMLDGTLILNLEYKIEKEYEFELEEEVEEEHDKSDYSFEYDPSTDDMEMVEVYKPGSRSKYEAKFKATCFLFRVKYMLTIKDQKITKYELKEWDFG